jgi:hypothetical protein
MVLMPVSLASAMICAMHDHVRHDGMPHSMRREKALLQITSRQRLQLYAQPFAGRTRDSYIFFIYFLQNQAWSCERIVGMVTMRSTWRPSVLEAADCSSQSPCSRGGAHEHGAHFCFVRAAV